MNIMTISGLPMLAWQVGFIVVASVSVWIAAKMTGAAQATLLRSELALIAGTVVAVIALFAAGGLGLALAPLAYLVAFKFILDTSFVGAIVLALAGYVGMSTLISGGISF